MGSECELLLDAAAMMMLFMSSLHFSGSENWVGKQRGWIVRAMVSGFYYAVYRKSSVGND